MLRLLRSSAAEILDSLNGIIAPRLCLLCGSHTGESAGRFEFICNCCADSLVPAPDPDQLFNRLVEIFPQDDIALSRVIAEFGVSEEPPFAELLHALKYRGFSSIGLEFGRELGAFLCKFSPASHDLVIPVPVHAARLRQRGYNQSELLVRGIAEILKLPFDTGTLIRAGNVQSQTMLNAEERRANVEGIFCVKRKEAIFGKNILLVDDVYTTGATLNSAATALLEAGALRVDGATLAAALRA